MQSVTTPEVVYMWMCQMKHLQFSLNVCESVYNTVENVAIYRSSVRETEGGRECVDVLEMEAGWSTGHRVSPINHTNNMLLPHQQKIPRNLSSAIWRKKGQESGRGVKTGEEREKERVRKMRINSDRLPSFFNENGLIGWLAGLSHLKWQTVWVGE